MEERYLKRNDVNLHYVVSGTGDPIIMLHGNGEDLHVFDELAGALSRSYRVIRMDSRGHGKSILRAKIKELNFQQFCGDIFALMDAEKTGKAVLLGFSDGANAALAAAADSPDRICAVVAISGNMNPSGLKTPVLVFFDLEFAFFTALEWLARTKRIHERILNKKMQVGLLTGHPRITAGDLSKISMPVLLLTGNRDLIRPQHSEWIHANIPLARLIFVKNAGHFDVFKRTAEYAGYITDFLTNVKAGQVV